MTAAPSPGSLQDFRVNLRIQLAGLWTSLTLCYLYCDYFELYQPGKLASMLAGRMGPLGQVTQGILLTASILLAIPGLMVALSLLLPARLCRLANLLFGVLFTLIMAVILPQAWRYYQFFAVVEILITATLTGLAWRWPRADPAKPA
ncbi:MAG: hypothetical protein HY014_14045 [Acidobacteria bacterium]|nr:hypothetical protein [Acidobacteriota bacterium]MBI3489280.1 hypothetical protein [Acidobacteriota bacterium]